MPPVIHWFRRDLRLLDNSSLHAAAATGAQVIPVYVVSSWKNHHRWTGPRRQEFLCGCLRSLDSNLRTFGSRLIIRDGDAADALCQLARESGASSIHFNRDVDPHGQAVEAELLRKASAMGLACHGYKDAVLHEAHEVLTQSGTPFKVFTPYGRAWMPMEKTAPLGKPKAFTTPGNLHSLPLPDLNQWGLSPALASPENMEPGERAARQRMKQAVSGIVSCYADQRDIPSGHTTSRLSQDLRHGLISIRELYSKVAESMRQETTAEARRGHQIFLQELAWREFYMQVLHHKPEVLTHEFNADYQGIPWDQDPEKLLRWQNGTTGFPFVDAGMRQLKATGFMHNRVRMIVSMFLTKDLHLDWRLGEKHFMRELLDGEIASNNGGWQWSAGTGADAAPYFRIQNPWTQTKRFDPEGIYIKQWIPELAKVPPQLFIEPPRGHRPLAADYPTPMLDHSTERDITLARFKEYAASRR